MLGNLFHRRGHSTPSSPVPDQLSPFDPAEHTLSLQSRPDVVPRPSNSFNTPPVRPASSRPDGEAVPNRKASEQSLRDLTSPSASESSFMGGIALRRVFESNRQDSSSSATQNPKDKAAVRTKPVPPPIHTNMPSTRPPPIPVKDEQHASSFVSPIDSGNKVAATGKRPAGTRLTSEPPALAAVAQTVVENQRAKKGLPFLKNSMSGLLLRRKASQNAPDLNALPLPHKSGEAAYQPIRGTRFHDFSAPRTRTVPKRGPPPPDTKTSTVSTNEKPVESTQNVGDLPLRTQTKAKGSVTIDASPEGASKPDPQAHVELSKAPSNTPSQPANGSSLDDIALPVGPPQAPISTANNVQNVQSTGSTSKSRPVSAASSMKRVNPSTRTNKSRHLSLAEDATSLSALPRHMKSTSSRFSFDMKGVSEAAMAEKFLEERHRQKQLESKANGDSDHRDSRYDEFDDDAFDYDAAMMDDGLEEEIPEINDDYDENDYLEDEDPFEEDIPMVGDGVIPEDADEDQDDPDNDQENFAGFVFTRSNQHSSLVSPTTPGMVNTPRDAVGRPIGYAFTKDGTPVLDSETSPLTDDEEEPTEQQKADVSLAGLGIQGLEAPRATQYDPTVFQERRNLPPIDDLESGQDKGLYYDGGLLDELQMEASEIQASTFDENLFDLDDVDQFGRPLPGVFAQNLDMRSKSQAHKQRDSDITSPGSEASESTAHTSVSVGLQQDPSIEETLKATGIPAMSTDDDLTTAPPQKAATASTGAPVTQDAYQMALLEGVQKAAASGWTSRWDTEDGGDAKAESEEEEDPHAQDNQSELKPQTQTKVHFQETSLPRDCDVTITSPTTGSQPSTAGLRGLEPSQADEYNDEPFSFDDDANFDDDDYFDDDFIAEANAEALAYDDEGFYGTEFGFYSAPPPARPSGPSVSENEPPTSNSVFGGYFGPSGAVGRSLSGRVLREPNLTPITEMSEPVQWSNRNSMMSLGLPSAALSDFRSVLSPGLAHIGGAGDDFEYTHGSLAQLRNKTFGGSQISLNSSREGSPRSDRPAMHAERFETLSPMPWDMQRPQSQLSPMAWEAQRQSQLSPMPWEIQRPQSQLGMAYMLPQDSPSVTGFPPQPLSSPPPIPQASACLPVHEEEPESPGMPTVKNTPALDGAELSPAATFHQIEEPESPGTRTVKNTPALNGVELSPAGTFGQDRDERRFSSIDTPLASPDFEPRSEARNTLAFGVNSAIDVSGDEDGFATATGLGLVDGAPYNVLLKGPCFLADTAPETLEGVAQRESR